MSWLFTSSSQSIRASASVHPMTIQGNLKVSFRTDWFDLLAVKELSRIFSNTTVQKHQFFGTVFTVQLSHPYMTTGKTIALNIWTFVGKVMSPLSNMLSRLVIAFIQRSKCPLISWLQSPSAVILEPKKSLVAHTFLNAKDTYIPL